MLELLSSPLLSSISSTPPSPDCRPDRITDGEIETKVFRGRTAEIFKGPVKAQVNDESEMTAKYTAETGEYTATLKQTAGAEGEIDLGPAGKATVEPGVECDIVQFVGSGELDWSAITFTFEVEIEGEKQADSTLTVVVTVVAVLLCCGCISIARQCTSTFSI